MCVCVCDDISLAGSADGSDPKLRGAQDCMYEGPRAQFGEPGAYAGEAVLALNAVEAQARPITLSWSPGGGMSLDSAGWLVTSPAHSSGHSPVACPVPAPGAAASTRGRRRGFGVRRWPLPLWAAGVLSPR